MNTSPAIFLKNYLPKRAKLTFKTTVKILSICKIKTAIIQTIQQIHRQIQFKIIIRNQKLTNQTRNSFFGKVRTKNNYNPDFYYLTVPDILSSYGGEYLEILK